MPNDRATSHELMPFFAPEISHIAASHSSIFNGESSMIEPFLTVKRVLQFLQAHVRRVLMYECSLPWQLGNVKIISH
jgi:hypothetical protein